VGLAARVAFLTFGSDNLPSLFYQKKFTGTDFYMGLKINGFSLFKGNGISLNRKKSGKLKRRKIKCYSF
jgi:hypothetical protein